MIPVSVYIICQNEEKYIEKMLQSIIEFEEIIIVDSGSTDQTLEIAKKYTDKIFHQEWLGFSGQKEYAKNLCSHQWVLNLDADEVVTNELKEEIKRVIEEDKIDGLDIQRSVKYLDKFPHPLSHFNRRIRFFRKKNGYYPEKMVHESIVVNGKIEKAKGFIFDYGTSNLKTHLRKIDTYSTLRAVEKFSKGKEASLIKLIFLFPFAFIKLYIIRREFLNGKRGFIYAMNDAYYAFLKEAKLYEKSLEENNDE